MTYHKPNAYYFTFNNSFFCYSPSFNNPERLQTLIKAYANDLAMSVAQSGHLYAITCAAKNLTPTAQIAELFAGMSQVKILIEKFRL